MKYLLAILLFIIYFSSFGQDEGNGLAPVEFDKDRIVIDVDLNTWLSYPKNVKIKPWSAGAGAYYMVTLIGKNSNVGFAIGLGTGAYNIKSNTLPSDTGGVSFFSTIPDSIKYSTNKLSTTYIELPVEIRFRSNLNKNNNSFKFYVGAKIGYLVNSHIKYKGDDYRGISASTVKFKQYDIKNLLPYNYGLMAHIGYGVFSFHAYYSLSALFEKNKGPEIVPLSLGFSIIFY